MNFNSNNEIMKIGFFLLDFIQNLHKSIELHAIQPAWDFDLNVGEKKKENKEASRLYAELSAVLKSHEISQRMTCR